MPAHTQSLSSSSLASTSPSSAKPVSEKKLAANRANAARSTGPRTPEGKARSSMNAVTHGMTAQSSVLPGEDDDELDELAAAMNADLRPRGELERSLVGRIVSLTWRLRRVAHVEEALWDRDAEGTYDLHCRRVAYGLAEAEDGPPPAESGASLLAKALSRSGESAFERLGIYEQRLDRALHAALRQFHQTRKMRAERGEEPGEPEGDGAQAVEIEVDDETEADPDPEAATDPAVQAGDDRAPAAPSPDSSDLQNEPTEAPVDRTEAPPDSPPAPPADAGEPARST